MENNKKIRDHHPEAKRKDEHPGAIDKLPLRFRVLWRMTCAILAVTMFSIGYPEAGIGSAIAGNMF